MELEIWSDIACPWCYIGRGRLKAALSQFEHADEVEVIWRSFELDPSAPAERPGELAAHLARKYGIPLEQARQSQASLAEVAAGEGIAMHFDTVRSGNTFDGHRLIHLAAAGGLGDAMKERLLRGYFSEGLLIADAETLVELGAQVGLPVQEIREMLAGEQFAQEVRDDEELARELGIGGVPTFIVDRRLGVTGAQDPQVLLELLRQAHARAQSSAPS